MNPFKVIASKLENAILLCQKFPDKFNHETGLKILLAKQCKLVGARIIDIDFNNDRWYETHQWTAETEQVFKDWMINWIKCNDTLARQVFTITWDPYKCYPWYNLMWGWPVKDFKDVK